MDRDLWYGTSGPHNAPIVIVGESWGSEEAALKRPFVGSSGQELTRMLSHAGLSRADILFTNMVAEQPHGNETFRFFTPKASITSNTQRVAGLFPSDLVRGEVGRLYRQLAAWPRSLVIATGNWSLWALSGRSGTEVIREANGRKVPPELQTYGPTGITLWRGSMLYCEPHPEFGDIPAQTKLLPLIHPAAILRQWSMRDVTIHDLKKRVPLALKNDWRPSHIDVWAPPDFDTATGLLQQCLDRARREQIYLACDIETFRRQFISCIGFANSPTAAMCIPFIREVTHAGITSYWTPNQEAQIISLIRQVLTHPNIRIIGQNFIYDTQYIQHWWGCTPRLFHDTMLAQNVLFPGTPKDLSHLSSLYCHYHWYWKDDVKDWSKFGNLNQLLEYNCIDNMRTYEIGLNQLDYIKLHGQEEQMRLKMDTNRLCLRMMNRGILYDNSRRGPVLSELMDYQARLQHELLAIIPQDFVKPHQLKKDGSPKKGQTYWYNSAQQTAELLYDILGMDEVRNRKTGSRTVGKEALPVLERKYPEFTALFRRLDSLGSLDNTIQVINMKTEHDGRIRCSYNPGGTETHRLSSSENVFGRGTNLQNLSKGEEDE